jgi:hypothetical protein
MEIKEALTKVIKTNRPKLSDSSCKTYVSLLSSIYKKLDGKHLDFFEDEEKTIIEHIKSLDKPQSRKTICSALFVVTEKPIYKFLMMDDVKVVNDIYKTQKVDTTKPTRTYEEIKATHQLILDKLKKNTSIENYVNVIISYLSTGILDDLPPRRILDYAMMKTKNYDKESDNYMEKNKFVFNIYKTANKYGKQIVDIPVELIALFKKWKKINETDFLIITDNGNPFTSKTLSKRVITIFGVGMDQLRSIYLSSVYKDIPKIEEMEKRAYQMGHSIQSALNYYVKKD